MYGPTAFVTNLRTISGNSREVNALSQALHTESRSADAKLKDARALALKLIGLHERKAEAIKAAWARYKAWHAEYASRAFPPQPTRKRRRAPSLLSLPPHLVNSHIMPHIPQKNKSREGLASLVKKNNPFKNYANKRRAMTQAVADELAELLSRCLPLFIRRTILKKATLQRTMPPQFTFRSKYNNSNNNNMNAVLALQGVEIEGRYTYAEASDIDSLYVGVMGHYPAVEIDSVSNTEYEVTFDRNLSSGLVQRLRDVIDREVHAARRSGLPVQIM